MSDLHLDSLEIKNFRCFEHLVIEKLGRVNLIVGRNSVGKTCLLEAIRLYTSKAFMWDLWQILIDRDDIYYKKDDNVAIDIDQLSSLFYNLKIVKYVQNIEIGKPNNDAQKITLNIGYPDGDSIGLADVGERSLGFFYITHNSQKIFHKFPASLGFGLGLTLSYNSPKGNRTFVPTGGIGKFLAARLWDQAVLEGTDAIVLKTLRILVPKISNIYMISGDDNGPIRYPFVKLENTENPIRLSSMGDGMMRVFGLALATVKSKNGYLLIDEFENGLHHSVQVDIWRMIFETAKLLNTQVFATTHSWDCVEAFQEAAAEDHNEEAMLIRLQRKKDGTGIQAISYDERRMAIATEQGIEVR